MKKFHKKYSEDSKSEHWVDATGTEYRIYKERATNSVLYKVVVLEGGKWMVVASLAALTPEHALDRASDLYYKGLGERILKEHKYDEREFIPQFKNYGRRKVDG